jgi:UDP-2-acetamido-2-deoxy-ribo-hexuluronate aminotransferase
MDVPFIDLGPVVELVSKASSRQTSAPFTFLDVLKRHEFIGKESVTKLEARLREQLGVKHAVVVANGTDALVLALRARGVGKGHIVAVPNLTFWATYEAVVTVGATPMLFDVDEDDLQLSFEQLTSSKRLVKAVVLVHLFGWASAKLNDFREWCKHRDIALIEDGAQAFGVEFDGRSVFADASLATLSFHPAKVIGGIGDGGAVLTNDTRAAEYVRLLANHARTEHYTHAFVGGNSRMSGIEAAWLLRVLDVSGEIISNRRDALARYVTSCMDQENFKLVRPPQSITGNGYLAVVKTQPRVDTSAGLGRVVALKFADRHIGCGRIYPTTIDGQPGERFAFRADDLEVSRSFVQDVVNLPLYYGVPLSHQETAWQALVEITKALHG